VKILCSGVGDFGCSAFRSLGNGHGVLSAS
jgi:hypothetical protein